MKRLIPYFLRHAAIAANAANVVDDAVIEKDVSVTKDCTSASASAGIAGKSEEILQCPSGGGKVQFSDRNSKPRGSSIAIKAAEEAKNANDEMASAVQEATRKIRLQYAEKAISAATAAEAVLASKQQVLEQLENEVREAEAVIQEETEAMKVSEDNAATANTALGQAKQELRLLKQAYKLAQENFDCSEKVAVAGKQSLTKKMRIIEAAKNRVTLLLRQLKQAREDFTNTKKASFKASCSAQEAKQRIERQRRKVTWSTRFF